MAKKTQLDITLVLIYKTIKMFIHFVQMYIGCNVTKAAHKLD